MKKFLSLICIMIAILMCSAVSASAEKAVYAASATGEVSIHISPDRESYVLEVVPSCKKMVLIRQEDTWGLVRINNKAGWVNMSFTRDKYKLAAEATGYDSVKNVSVKSESDTTILYSLPSTDERTRSEEKYTVPTGTVVKIVRETASGWALVRVSSDYAWVRIENTVPYKTETEEQISNIGIYYVYTRSAKNEGTKLYAKNNEASVLRTIPDCAKLTVREVKGSYIYTSYDGVNGWVKKTDTTSSLADAQSNAGTVVEEEFIMSAETNIYNVPSDEPAEGTVAIGKIGSNERIFVQRITFDGWMLINYDGVIGWISPESAQVVPDENVSTVEVLEEFLKGYMCGEKNTGVKLYGSPKNKDYTVTVPECIEVEIIAEEDGYYYVRSDYAAGWVDKKYISEDFEAAVSANLLEKNQFYVLEKDSSLMSLPTSSELCYSEVLLEVANGEKFTVSRIVTTGKSKWGYTEIDGKSGWIKLSMAKKTVSTTYMVVFIAIIVLAVLVAGWLIYLLIKVILKRRKNKMCKKTYEIEVAGVKRQLPMFDVNDKISIAAFIMFGDVELTTKCAEALIKKVPEHDIMITAEAKSIPLICEMARQMGVNDYIIARKKPKVYMSDVIEITLNSITTVGEQKLYLGKEEYLKMKGKKVLIVDDVISTGESLKALENLVEKVGGKIVGKAAVLAEGDAADRDDIIYLEKLPLFDADGKEI